MTILINEKSFIKEDRKKEVLFIFNNTYIIHTGKGSIRALEYDEITIIDNSPIILPTPYNILNQYGEYDEDVYFDIGDNYHLQLNVHKETNMINYYNFVTGELNNTKLNIEFLKKIWKI